MRLNLPAGWTSEGPFEKSKDTYLSRDGRNPDVPEGWKGYGWPLGTTCWYYLLHHDGCEYIASGSTIERAAAWAEEGVHHDRPWWFFGDAWP